jgi:hypothetical protein
MIKSLSQATQLLSNVNLPMVNQEGNAQPGEGLTFLETFTYFFAIPTAMFLIIGGLSWIASAPRAQKRKEITKGDNDDSVITFIA